MPVPVTLDGHSLAIEDVVSVARHGASVAVAAHSLAAVHGSRRVVEAAIARGDTMYGVTTGFGKLAHVRIRPEQARELQRNLIRSHASGVGDPLSVEAVRAMMLLRANVLLRGTSGVRPALPELIVAMLNQRVHARIPDARPHPQQRRSAALLRELLTDSAIRESHRVHDPRVQDAYSLRCTPQVLGAVGEGLAFAERLVATELNAATDNPLVFDGDVLSGGNFHGQPVALALDVVGIALATLAGLAERRLERIVNPDLSSGLPPFLARDPGLESGFMTAQIAAAALAADCRVLATPASVQSVPTEGNQEDVVPMGMSAAWKAQRILGNAERVIAIELLAGAQGLEYLKPLRPAKAVARLYAAVRQDSAALASDRPLTADIETVAAHIRAGRFAP